MKNNDFTSGAILPKLLKFMLPVLFAMFLQAMYGAVDLLVVGQFSTNADVSAVSTGSQIMHTLTNLIVSFAMGITVAVGQKIGENRPDEAAHTIGTGLFIFAGIGIVFTIVSVAAANPLAIVMQAPAEAFDITVKVKTSSNAVSFLFIFHLTPKNVISLPSMPKHIRWIHQCEPITEITGAG